MIEPRLTEIAERVLRKRYLQKDPEGKFLETPRDRYERVARFIAEAEKNYGIRDPEEIAPVYYAMMARGDFMPNSPCVANAGKPGGTGQFSACFVLPVPDSMAGIFETLKSMALIHKTGGGTGFAFSRLRPAGDFVRTTSGVASGPISFMEIYDHATEGIKQGGMRRGANMGILRVDHPDILEFISCKADTSKIENFNISVAATTEFMRAVEAGLDYDLRHPMSGDVVGSLNAQEVWDKIIRQAHATGEPGLFFIDRVNEADPLSDVLGEVEATNPCVTGDTLILTRYGQVPIETVVGEPVDVWNGRAWSTVRPRITGTDQPIVRVELSDGLSLQCTPYHTFYLADGTSVRAGELQPEDVLEKLGYTPPTEGGYPAPVNPYLAGFYQGDGYWNTEKGRQEINFYGEKVAIGHDLEEDGLVTLQPYSETQDRLRGVLLQRVPEKGEVPLNWNREDSLQFLAGLLDSDGNVVFSDRTRRAYGYQISSVNREFLVGVAHLLRQLGVPSTLAQSHAAGNKEMPGGVYDCRACFRISIPPGAVNRLREIGLQTRRLYSGPNRPQRDALRFPRVAAVTPAGRADRVYCFTEPDRGRGVFSSMITGQCGEVPLRAYDACTLGSINLANFWREVDDEMAPATRGSIDFEALKKTIHHAVRFLDSVLDMNSYPVEEIYEVTRNSRKIGLGVMGWADLLIRLGIPYDSDRALHLATEVMRFVNREAVAASEELAEERGAFPLFDKSRWAARGEHPRRNSTVTVIAPTGTISILAGCSSGIEPLFALAMTRNQADMRMTEVHPLVREIGSREGWWNEEVEDYVKRAGTLRGAPDVPRETREVFRVANELSMEAHVKMQAAFQEHTQDAVSKTINLHRDAPPERVAEAYQLAWTLGCKGITVYRDGARPAQVLSAGTEKKERPAKSNDYRRRIPEDGYREGATFTKRAAYGSVHVNITRHPDDDEPFELFVDMGENGSELRAFIDALGKTASLALKVSSDPTRTLEELGKQLSRIPGSEVWRGPEGQVITSAPDAVAHAIRDYLDRRRGTAIERAQEGEGRAGDLCPECGSSSLYRAEGCNTCRACGFSRC